MKLRRVTSSAVAVLTIALAGCSSQTSVGGCPASLPVPPQLIFPSPGATSVDPAIGEILVGGASLGTQSISVRSSGGSLSGVGSVQIAATPFPAGAPLPPSVGYDEAVSVPVLSAATTYTVSGVVQGCTSSSTVTIGSFATK